MKITRSGLSMTMLATVAAALAGCAGNTASMQAGATAEEGHVVYDRIVAKIYGTAEQREAAQERAWLTAQSAIANCAQNSGAEYAVTAYQQMLPATTPAPGDVLAFAPQRTDFGVALRIKTLAARGEGTNPGLAKLTTTTQRDKWFEAVTSCQNAAEAGDALTVPAGQEALDGKFADTLTTIQEQAAPQLPDDYANCMHTAGIEAKSLPDTYTLVEDAFPKISYEQPSDASTTEGWTQAVAFEDRAAAADWSCRKDQQEPVFAAAANPLTEFETANATELDAVAAGWQSQPEAVSKLRNILKITR